ncbi:hypothetical protein [Egbenema bharatensis]|uniref:hypothetical protein n=1 Tax=Egbenema bharatensis TaxID=3463334 RepID=UPI003A875B1B
MQQKLRSPKALRESLFYAELFVALLLVGCSVVIPYLTYQQAFIGGDILAGFYNRTIEVSQEFRETPITAIRNVFEDGNSTYNSFFTLPLIPLILLLGESYLAFVISLAIVYLLPLNIVLGVMATRLIPVYPKAVFISTVFIATLIAPNWVTILVGHPDIGATLIISLAILACLRGMPRSFDWPLPYRWQVPFIGVLLGVAVLFRRHYAYAALAVVGAIGLQAAIVIGQEVRKSHAVNWRKLLGFGLRLGLLLSTSLVTLTVFAPEFTQQAISTDYVSLYDSWTRTVEESIGFYSTLYGLGTWLLVLLGFGLGLWTGVLRLAPTTFVICFGGISIAIWLFRLRYTETYYAIHFVPFIILGLAGLFWTIWLQAKRPWRNWCLAAMGLYLSFNFIVCLTPIGSFQNSLRPWFAASYPPFVRQNYNEVIELMQFLRQLTPNGEPIFVVHTGPLPNHLLRAAEQTVYGEERVLTLRGGSVIDSIGYYSLRELLEAEYVVLTEPFVAWHEGQQDTAKVVVDAFTQEWEITQDFEPLPEQFDLRDGITARIYRRIQPTSIDRAVRTLHAMQTEVNKPLGGQLDWITVSPPFNSVIRQEEAGYSIRVRSLDEAAESSTKSFLYIGQFSEVAELQGQVNLRNEACAGVNFRAASMDEQGNVMERSADLAITEQSAIQLSVNTAGATYLLLEIENPALQTDQPDRCALTINQLAVN